MAILSDLNGNFVADIVKEVQRKSKSARALSSEAEFRFIRVIDFREPEATEEVAFVGLPACVIFRSRKMPSSRCAESHKTSTNEAIDMIEFADFCDVVHEK